MVLFLFFHITTIFTGAPYLGMGKGKLGEVIQLAHIQKGERTVDLGSGDGRIVIAFAQKGAEAYGYELNPFFVLLSWWNIYKAGLWGKAHIYFGNLWNVDISTFDVITIYGISYIMNHLEKKLKKESKKDTRIITSCYSFPSWTYKKKIDHTFLYTFS